MSRLLESSIKKYLNPIFVLFFLLFLVQTLYSQNLNVNWGKAHTVEENVHLKKIVTLEEDTYILRLSEEKSKKKVAYKPILEKYNQANNLVFSKALQLPGINGKIVFGDLFVLDGQLGFVFVEASDNLLTAYLCPVSDSGEVAKTAKKLMQIKNDEEDQFYASLQINQQKDKAIFYQVYYENNQLLINYTLIEDELEAGKPKTFSLSALVGYTAAIDQILLDNAGNIRVLWHFIEPKAENIAFYQLVTYHVETSSLTVATLDIKPYLLNGYIQAGPEGNVYFFAWISAQKDGYILLTKVSIHPSTTLYYAKFDQKGKLIKENREKLPEEFLIKIGSKDDLKKHEGIQSYYTKFKTIHFSGDNKAMAIAEIAAVYEYYKGESKDRDHSFINYSMIGFFFDTQTLSLGRSIQIPKSQNTYNDEGFFSSFASFEFNNTYYLLYNDHKDNVEKSIDELTGLKYLDVASLSNMNKAQLVIISFSTDGSVVSKRWYDKGDMEQIVSPLHVMHNQKNEIILYSRQKKGHNSCIGKMRL